jgi:hypothetical protein
VQQLKASKRHSAGQSEREPASVADWLTTGRFLLILAALVFLSFPQVLLGFETFVARDYGFFSMPVAQFQKECFWRGELPFWNPYNHCGIPFLAQWNTMPLYPPALIYLLLPLTWSLSFFGLLHLFFAGVGMYFLAWRWTGDRWAAGLAGVVFSFNGLSLHLLMWPSHIATLSWMPWVMLTVERAWQEGGRRLVVAALAGALQMLAGGPETILITWLLLLAIWCVDFWRGRISRAPFGAEAAGATINAPEQGGDAVLAPATVRRRLALRFSLVVLVVAGLAAAQLLPFLDLVTHSLRSIGFANTRWSMPGWGWANFLVPMVFGSTWKQDLFYQYGQLWTSSYYLGTGGLVLAVLGAWKSRNARARLLIVAAVLGLGLAMGDNSVFSALLRKAIPALSLIMYPVKFVVVPVFAAPLLAAFALAMWRRAKPGEERAAERNLIWVGGILMGLIAVILIWAWRWPFPEDDYGATSLNGLERAAFLAGFCLVLVALGRNRQSRRSLLMLLLLLMISWLDVWTHEPTQNPTLPGNVYALNLARNELAMEPQPALGAARAMVSPTAETQFMLVALKDARDNYLAKRLGYFSDCNLLDDVPKVNGFFSLWPRECGELNAAIYGWSKADYSRLADFMSVSHVTAPGAFSEWQPRTNYLPLVTAGQTPLFVEDVSALRTILSPEFDGGKTVLLPPDMKSSLAVNQGTRARVLSQHFGMTKVETEVEAEHAALVVIAQTYYHDWRATVDGAPAKLLRANYAFQAVEVPAGRHRVELKYQDRAFELGASISGISMLACLAGWVGFTRVSRAEAGTKMEARK